MIVTNQLIGDRYRLGDPFGIEVSIEDIESFFAEINTDAAASYHAQNEKSPVKVSIFRVLREIGSTAFGALTDLQASDHRLIAFDIAGTALSRHLQTSEARRYPIGTAIPLLPGALITVNKVHPRDLGLWRILDSDRLEAQRQQEAYDERLAGLIQGQLLDRPELSPASLWYPSE